MLVAKPFVAAEMAGSWQMPLLAEEEEDFA